MKMSARRAFVSLSKAIVPKRIRVAARKGFERGKFLYNVKGQFVRNRYNVYLMQRTGRLVLEVGYGGLGDHLTYSSLPRLLTQQRNIRVLVSTRSVRRSPEIMEFVWGRNPYVTFTSVRGYPHLGEGDRRCSNLNEMMEGYFGLQGKGLPEVYYVPKCIPSLEKRYLVDATHGPAGLSNGYETEDFEETYVEFLRKEVKDFVLIQVGHTYANLHLQERLLQEFKPDTIAVNYLTEMADLLYSCRMSFLLYTGSASLAAAILKPAKVICRRRSNPYFVYATNEYIDI